jgi:hypothetical protein
MGPDENWARVVDFAQINRGGLTQVRLHFTVGDNDDNVADYMKFFSGDAGSSKRPRLIVEYYVP